MERSRNPAKRSLHVFQFVAAMVFLHVVAGAPTASPKCSGKPADVFFVMDASASIWAPDFRKQLIFVQDVIKEFDFNDGNTRVGAMTFGDYPYLQFTFDTHTQQSAILKAVQETWQTGGNTKTAEALRYMRDLVTTSARADVARVVIVITDGESHDAVATAREAALARASGIHLMAIGVGSAVIHKELEAIANEPAKENVFTVSNYDALENIRGLLAIKTCTAPVIEHLPANTVEERRYGDQTLTTSAPSKSQSRDCKQKPADIVFVADSSSSIWDDDFQKQLNFIETIVKDFDISSEQTRIGMVTFSDHGHHEFHLNTFTNSGDILNAVSSTKQTLGETNTADALRKMRKAFSVKHGGRPGVVPQIAIVMTDGRSNDPVLTVFEAGQAHRHNIHVFAIGIGGDVDKQELSSITNSPTDQHVFQVDSYKALTTIKELLASKTCAVKEQESGKTKAPPINDQAGCGRDGKADIIFAIPGAIEDKETAHTLNFIRKFIGAFHISHHGIRIGLAPRTCNALPGFDLDEYPSSIELHTSLQYKIDSLKPVQDSKVARMLRYMRTEGFRHTHGARNHVKKIAVLFIDHTSKDSEIDIIAGEVQKLRRHHNIDMYVVGVGKGVSQGVLETMASHPLSRFISTVSNYGDLDSVKDSLSQHICLSL